MDSLYLFFQPILAPQTDADQVTRWFALGILLLFICLLWSRNTRRFSQQATTFFGILGTFVGIYFGLRHFDPKDIQQSVPPLLAGLKTAFLTSIFGIGATLLTRTYDFFSSWASPNERRTEGATVQTLAEILQEQTKAMQEQTQALQEQTQAEKENHLLTLKSLESIRSSVSGDGDTSMLTQIQKLRLSFDEKQNALIQEFKTFAQNMAEANTDALIKALEGVIKDFNAKINEQFGENFQQLNEAVGSLVVWQDKNKEQTERMIQHFDATVSAVEEVRESIAQMRDSMTQIAERSRAITDAAEQLAPILSAIQEQRESLAGYMGQFAEISEKAKELLPTLETKINELTENFSQAVMRATETNQKALDAHKEFAQTVINGFSELGSELGKTTTDVITQVGESAIQNMETMRVQTEDAAKLLETLVSNLAGRLTSHIQETFTKTHEEIARLAGESAGHTEARMEEIDKRLGEALTKVLKEFGSRLASISEKFADDYTLLLAEWRKVLELARGDGNARL